MAVSVSNPTSSPFGSKATKSLGPALDLVPSFISTSSAGLPVHSTSPANRYYCQIWYGLMVPEDAWYRGIIIPMQGTASGGVANTSGLYSTISSGMQNAKFKCQVQYRTSDHVTDGTNTGLPGSVVAGAQITTYKTWDQARQAYSNVTGGHSRFEFGFEFDGPAYIPRGVHWLQCFFELGKTTETTPNVLGNRVMLPFHDYARQASAMAEAIYRKAVYEPAASTDFDNQSFTSTLTTGSFATYNTGTPGFTVSAGSFTYTGSFGYLTPGLWKAG